MANNYSQLTKRLDSLGGSNNVRLYNINFVTDEFDLHDRRVYNTPDEALKDVYEDARKHLVKYLHVEIMVSDMGNFQGSFVGYTWESHEVSVKDLYGGQLLPESNVRLWGCPVCGRYDPLAYPNPKPELEVFDLYTGLELDWCRSNGYPTIEAHEKQLVEDLSKVNPTHGWKIENMEIAKLIQRYRRAGYQVDYPHEPKNPVELP